MSAEDVMDTFDNVLADSTFSRIYSSQRILPNKLYLIERRGRQETGEGRDTTCNEGRMLESNNVSRSLTMQSFKCDLKNLESMLNLMGSQSKPSK